MTSRSSWKQLLWTTIGVGAVAASARLTIPVPGSPVPQSAQTLAVVLVGAWWGARRGTVTLVAYALVGALGVPVFSDGGSGWTHLVGPTGGYIIGFILAAGAIGALGDARMLRGAVPTFGAMLLGHALILGIGWAWLAVNTGLGEAYSNGVAPFMLGGVVKSAVGALAFAAWTTWSPKRRAAWEQARWPGRSEQV